MTIRMRVVSALAVACLGVLVARPARAQTHFGGELNVGTNSLGVGLGARVEAGLGGLLPTVKGLTGIASFDYFFPSGGNYWEINGNLGYHFQIPSVKLDPYAGGGLIIGHASASNCPPGFSCSQTNVGLNLLAGTNFPGVGKITPFLEMHIELRSNSAVVFTGGVLF